jgi:solute carrier family 13 (sodium-dependent dicarboxylate transporter), member 2/3/5
LVYCPTFSSNWDKGEGAIVALFFNARLGGFLVALVVGVIGYSLAPPDLVHGDYVAVVEVALPAEALHVEHSFAVGNQAGESVMQMSEPGTHQLVVEGPTAFRTGLNSHITYRAQVLDGNGQPLRIPLEQVSSVLRGPGFAQQLPAVEYRDGWYLFRMAMPYKAKIALGLLFAVAALWLSELIPLAAAAMFIPVVAVVAGVTDAQSVLEPFAHPIIVLFLAGFLLAEGMHRTGIDRRVALTILSRASLRPTLLMLTMMGLTAFLSMWMSNTAAVALIIPIALAVLDKIPSEDGLTEFRRALILGIAYAATIGGVGSAIGTPANMLAITYLNDFAGANFTFVDWFRIGLPMTVLMVPIIWLYLLLSFRVRSAQLGAADRAVYLRELAALGPLKVGERVILATFVAVMTLWLTEQWHATPTAIVALGGALVLFVTGLIDREDLQRVNWNALLTFGGGLAIGALLLQTGVSDWIALRLTGLAELPSALVIVLVAGLTLLIGAFISNTACAAMLIPIALPLAQILQIDPTLLVAVVAIASSVDFALVVGTPPTMLAYSTGLFRVRDIVRRGVALDLIGLLVLSFAVVQIWQWLGVVRF